MEEHFFQSRGKRVLCYVLGTVIIVAHLILMLIGVRVFLTVERLFRTSPAGIQQLAERAQREAWAAEALRESQEMERQMAAMRRALHVMVFWGHGGKTVFWLAFGLALIVMPIRALRRARRRALSWKQTQTGLPWHKSSLAMLGILAVFLSLWPPVLLCIPILAKSLHPDLRLEMLIRFVIFQSAGIVLLGLFVFRITRRLHFRDWRLRLEDVPAQPGKPVAFEMRRESGKPLDDGLRFELLGWKPKWNIHKNLTRSGAPLRRIPGDVRIDAPAAAGTTITGSIQLDNSRLTAVPPEGEKHPRRVFAFLRVRRGWWRKCLFDLPLPDLYLAPAHTQKK